MNVYGSFLFLLDTYTKSETEPSQTYELEKGSNLTVTCTSQGIPLPTVQWFYRTSSTSSPNRTSVSDVLDMPLGEPSQTNATLNLYGLSSADSGVYVCKASYLDAVMDVKSITILPGGQGKRLSLAFAK